MTARSDQEACSRDNPCTLTQASCLSLFPVYAMLRFKILPPSLSLVSRVSTIIRVLVSLLRLPQEAALWIYDGSDASKPRSTIGLSVLHIMSGSHFAWSKLITLFVHLSCYFHQSEICCCQYLWCIYIIGLIKYCSYCVLLCLECAHVPVLYQSILLSVPRSILLPLGLSCILWLQPSFMFINMVKIIFFNGNGKLN